MAGLIGTARRSGQDWAIVGDWKNYDAKDRFNTTEDIELEKYFVNPMPKIPIAEGFQQFAFNWGWNSVRLPHGNWDISGHFQSTKFFDGAMDEVRHYLTMKDEFDVDAVAVHFRFGDYDDHYHPRPRKEYYIEAIKRIGLDKPIYIMSDDMEAAEKMIDEIDDEHFSGGLDTWLSLNNTYLHDFKIMKRCQHFICGNSSYSLMAAILAPNPDKIVVCPKNWFGPAWGVGMNEQMTRDLYPANAIVI